MGEPSPPPPNRRPSWRGALASSTSVVYAVGTDGRVRYANRAFERLTGKTRVGWRRFKLSRLKGATGWADTLAVPPETWAGEVARVRRALPGELTGPPWLDITFVPLTNAAGDVRLVLATAPPMPEADDAPKSAHVPAEWGRLRQAHAERFRWADLECPSPAVQRLLAQARFAATNRAPVWLAGAPGSGKLTLARTVHHASPARDFAFVRLDASAVPAHLLDGQLFGKAGLSSIAAIGTVYVAPVERVPPELQRKLLAYFASHRSPRVMVGSGSGAAELIRRKLIDPGFAALAVFELALPKLSERPGDVAVIAARWSASAGIALDPRAVAMLTSYDWPGEARELIQTLNEAKREARSGPILPLHLPRLLHEKHLLATHPAPAKAALGLDEILTQIERRLVQQALAQAGGSQTVAAKLLKLNRTALWRRMNNLGLVPAASGGAAGAAVGDAG